MDRAFWDQMAALENRMETMFRGFGFWAPARRIGVLSARPFTPSMDVIARNGDTVLRLDLPGIDPAKDVTVTAADGELTIHGERHEASEIEEKDYYRSETFHGEFERQVPLPTGTPTDRITAQYENGVLEVVIPGVPKRVEPKPKSITVKTKVPAKA